MNKIYPIAGKITKEEFLTPEALERFNTSRCVILGDKEVTGKHFLLVGRHETGRTKYRLTIRLKIKSKTKWLVQTAYISVSKEAYKKVNKPLKILENITVVMMLAGIFNVVCGLVWLFGFSIPDALHIPSRALFISVVPIILWFIIAGFIVERYELFASRKIVQLDETYNNYGVPDYNQKMLDARIESDNVPREIAKALVLEKELQKITKQ
jgi:hypothetical protein